MGILQQLKNKLPVLRNTDKTRYNQFTNLAYHPTTSYNNLQKYYKAMENKDVYRCIEVYKNTSLACDFNISTDTIEHDSIPTQTYLEHLFRQPEGYKSTATWSSTNSLIWDSFLGLGDCFFEISTDDNFNMLNGFKYIHNNSIMWNNENSCYALAEQPEVQYEPGELIHIYKPNLVREKSPWGVSVISRCEPYIALIINALHFNNDILVNDGLDPNAFLKFGDNVSPQNMQSELNRLREEMKQSRGKGVLALQNAEWVSGIRSNKDMSYLELMKFCRDNIIQCFGVPPQLAGIIETANLGSGSGDSQKKDWKITFDGASTFIEDGFNNCLKHHGFSERFEYQAMDVIDELYDAQVYQILVQNGIMSRDEIRNKMGLSKLENSWAGYYR